METCKARLLDRYGEYFGTCEVPVDPLGTPEVIMLEHWPGRIFVRDRKSDLVENTLVIPSYRQHSFGLGQKFVLRSGV